MPSSNNAEMMFVQHYSEKAMLKEETCKWEDGAHAALNDYDVVRRQ
jgi:hypothetical protein